MHPLRLRLCLFIFFAAMFLVKLSAVAVPYFSCSFNYHMTVGTADNEKCSQGEGTLDGLAFSDDETVNSNQHFLILIQCSPDSDNADIAYLRRYLKPYPPLVPTPPPNLSFNQS